MSKRDFVFEKDFPATGQTFGAITAAEKWCRDHGLSVGSMCSGLPIGLMRGDYAIMKWRNLSDEDRAGLDGQIEPIGDFRNGGARVKLRYQP